MSEPGLHPASSPVPPSSAVSVSSLRSWHASQPAPLLLDLRSHAAHRQRRVRPSVNVHWRQLEQRWFTLPPYGVPFAVLMPGEGEEAEADGTSAAAAAASTVGQRAADTSSTGATGTSMDIGTVDSTAPPPPPPADEGEDAKPAVAPDSSDTTGGPSHKGVKALARAQTAAASEPPLPPSSPAFRFSHSAVLSLLRFYGWVVPDEWVLVDSPQLWATAAEAGLTVDGSDMPLHQSLLFRPSPCLQKHFAHIHAEVARAHSERDAEALVQSEEANSPPAKRARHTPCALASSSSLPSPPLSSTTAAAAAAPAPLPAFECLDVACGSGRDMAWLLWEAQQEAHTQVQNQMPSAVASSNDPSIPTPTAALPSSPCPWRVSGLDSSGGALSRATQLARQLGLSAHMRVQRARINQSNGQWHVSNTKAAATVAVGTPDAVSDAAVPSHAATASEEVTATAAGASVFTASAPPIDAASPPVSAAKPIDLRREKRRRKEALKAAAAAAVASTAAASNSVATSPSTFSCASAVPASSSVSCASPSSLLSPCQYDLILMVRFLCRAFITGGQLTSLLRPGGFFLLSTFTDDGHTQYAQPSNLAFRLGGTREVEQLAQQAGLEVVCNDITRSEDGRPISDCLLRKPMNTSGGK